MATAFVFTHARHASEAATLEAMRRDLLQRGRARFKSVLREEAKLRGAAPAQRPALAPLPFKARPLRGCAALSTHDAADSPLHPEVPFLRAFCGSDARAACACPLAPLPQADQAHSGGYSAAGARCAAARRGQHHARGAQPLHGAPAEPVEALVGLLAPPPGVCPDLRATRHVSAPHHRPLPRG
jgi:hypothetical protein